MGGNTGGTLPPPERSVQGARYQLPAIENLEPRHTAGMTTQYLWGRRVGQRGRKEMEDYNLKRSGLQIVQDLHRPGHDMDRLWGEMVSEGNRRGGRGEVTP